MIKSAVTISLVKEAEGGPFVFWHDLATGCAKAAELGYDAVEVFAPNADAIPVDELNALTAENGLKVAAVGTGGGWVIHKWHLCQPDAASRENAKSFIRSIIDAGAQLGAPAIIGSTVMFKACRSRMSRFSVERVLSEGSTNVPLSWILCPTQAKAPVMKGGPVRAFCSTERGRNEQFASCPCAFQRGGLPDMVTGSGQPIGRPAASQHGSGDQNQMCAERGGGGGCMPSSSVLAGGGGGPSSAPHISTPSSG